MTPDQFRALMLPIASEIAGRLVDRTLADHLNATFPSDGEVVGKIEAACHEAIAAGWMCAEGAPGRRYGRVIQPAADSHDLSVDIVDLTDVVGPHHSHPNGEICLTMPVSADARFDGKGRGWCVYGPNSAHRPTVTGGRALVLYLLPEGKIAFTR